MSNSQQLEQMVPGLRNIEGVARRREGRGNGTKWVLCHYHYWGLGENQRNCDYSPPPPAPVWVVVKLCKVVVCFVHSSCEQRQI